MDAQPQGENEKPAREKQSLPVSEVTLPDVSKTAVQSISPAPTQQNLTATPHQQSAVVDIQQNRNPLPVVILRDDELSSFEKKTVFFGKLGLVIAAISLIAASAAAYFVFQQFKEMAAQTDLLNRGARQARVDSAASSMATAKQLAIMQGQLAQQQYAARLDQRAWLEIEPIKPKPYKTSTELYIYELFPKNVGKTAARNIVVRADNFVSNRESIENTKHADWIHNMQDKYLFGKFKGNPPLNRGTPVPSVLGPGTVSPIPITYISQVPQVFPGGFAMISAILGRIDYVDEFGVAHWIRFCFYPAEATGGLASCVAGNDEDRNPEIPSPENPN